MPEHHHDHRQATPALPPSRGSKSRFSHGERRELEHQIEQLKRDKVRIEDNVRRMEATQKRIFERMAEDRRQLPPASQAKGDAPVSRKRSRSGSAKREGDEREGSQDGEKEDGEKEDKEDKEDKDDKEDKEDKEGKEDKEDKEDKEEEKEEGEQAEYKPAEDEEKDDEKKEEKAEEVKEARDRRRRDREKDGKLEKPDPRSRNMFGKMLGHLHSAKSRLESEKGSKSTALMHRAQERTEEKLAVNKMNIQEFRKTQFEAQKKQEVAKAKEIERAIEEKEMLLLQKNLEAHYSLMMNFIRTKSEPTIFYLPAKHTKGTQHMLEETREAIEHKIASLKVQLQPVHNEDAEEDAMRASAAAATVAAADSAGGAEAAPAAQSGDAEVAKADGEDEAMDEKKDDKEEPKERDEEEKEDEKEDEKEEADKQEEDGDDDRGSEKAKEGDEEDAEKPDEPQEAGPEKKKRKTGKQKPTDS